MLMRLKYAFILLAVFLTSSANARDDPQWAPAGADIIATLNTFFERTVGPLQGRSANERNPQTYIGRFDFQVRPPTPKPERVYEWIASHAYPVIVVVFKTPEEARQCLDNNYTALLPYYAALPSKRPWPNFPTYISHSFTMTQFHGHTCYRGEYTCKIVIQPRADIPIQYETTKMYTEKQLLDWGLKIVEETRHNIAWIRGRTLMVLHNTTDWAEIELFHTLMHALPSAPGAVSLPPQPPVVAPPLPPPPPPPPPPASARRYRVFIDGQHMATSAPPTEVNGRILVGLADIFRELGADVTWDGAQRSITATRGAQVVQLWIGNTSALVNGSAISLDVPPMILAGGKTYVPVRFVSQALGADVMYDARNAAVMITTGNMPPLGGTPVTPPYTPPPPPQGTVQVSICRETGLRATGLCPNTLTRAFAPNAIPGPCTTHNQGPKVIITSPANGAVVPEQFLLSGTAIPGSNLLVTVIAEATLTATGQNAISSILDRAGVIVNADGRWSTTVNTRAVRNDKRVELKQFVVTVQMQEQNKSVEKVELIIYP